MTRAKGLALSGFRPKLHSRTESSSLESLDIRSGKSGHESRQGPRRISEFRPKLHSRAESLSFESLVIRSGKSEHESREGPRRIRIQTQIAESRREFDFWKSSHTA